MAKTNDIRKSINQMDPNTIFPYQGIVPRIHRTAFIAPNATIIGRVEIKEESSVWFNCVIRGDMNEIIIGKKSNIQDGTIIHVDSRTNGTYIGDRVTIGHLALVHACTIGDDCMIGMQATIMDGAVVDDGAIVAAGSLVTPGKRVRTRELWAGSPAKKVRNVEKKDLDMLEYIWPRYVELAREYINNLSDEVQ